MNVVVSPKKITFALLCFIIFLLLANVAGIVAIFSFNHDYIYGLVPLFNFDNEKNIPTLYSSFALIFASILLAFIASMKKKLGASYMYWLGLAMIFLFLSIDETASIHNSLRGPVTELLQPSGLFYFAWMIPYGILVGLFVIVYLRFLLGLPKKTMILFVVAGSIFVTGAIGFEMLAGRYVELNNGRGDGVVYAIFYTCEEFLEMLGIVIFIYALLSYISLEFQSLTFSIKDKD